MYFVDIIGIWNCVINHTKHYQQTTLRSIKVGFVASVFTFTFNQTETETEKCPLKYVGVNCENMF